MLSVDETKKFNRQIKLDGFGVLSQEKLKSSKVLLIGLGGLGCPAALYLAAAGVGTIGLVEFDKVDSSNLARQILFGEDDIGKDKLEIAKEKLYKINGNINVLAFGEKLTKENVYSIFKEFNLIVDGTDNFETRYLINDACVKMNLPLVHGSVAGFDGLVSLFNSKSNSPCFRCLHPVMPNIGNGCAEIGVLSTVTGIIGIQMAHECIKLITGCGETLDGRVMLFRRNNFETFNLIKDPDCPVCGNGEIIEKKPFLNELSLSEFEKIKEDFILLDIRESFEFAEKNLGGINMPYSNFDIKKLEHLKNKEIILVCYSGEKSKKVIELLQKNNFQKLYNLKGGIREAVLS
jgi:sulfur-carrier protein adenylyltransferase/sulfurtransferase